MSKLLCQSLVLATALAGVGCFPTSGTNTASTTGGNRFGYQGSAHAQGQGSGLLGQPTAAPDGRIADALRGSTPPAGSPGVINQPVVADNLRPVTPPQGPNPVAPPPPPPAPVGPATPPPASDLRGPNPTQPPTQPAPAPQPQAQTPPPAQYPVGIPVPGKEGLVLSPYDKEAGHVDVRGLKPGSMVECPYTLKYFLVP